jgi:hypothetical protein
MKQLKKKFQKNTKKIEEIKEKNKQECVQESVAQNFLPITTTTIATSVL